MIHEVSLVYFDCGAKQYGQFLHDRYNIQTIDMLCRINIFVLLQNEMGRKGGQRKVHDACKVCTLLCQKASVV